MPGETGVELLEKARLLKPNLVRIITTAYAEYDAAVNAVNSGRVFRYVHKPWDPDELSLILQEAVSHYQTLTEREELLAEKAESLRQMVMADKVAGLGIMAEGLNHHMRNALTVLRAFVDLAPMKLAEELGRIPADMSFWGDMHRQAQEQIYRIQMLLGRLGEASSVTEIPRNDYISISHLLDEVTSLYRSIFERHGILLTHEVQADLPVMLVNGARFSQLWRLIFADQLSHLRSGDQVHIKAELCQHSSGTDMIRFLISDTGHWQPEDDVANLFDPFFVRSHQPTEIGVNLTACYVIVHLHQGTITAKLREPRGLEIEMMIPRDCSAMPLSQESFEERLREHEERWRNRLT
jgi:signal transduction histidine kinase